MSKKRILSYLFVAIVIIALITVTGWGLYKFWERITPGYVYGKVYWIEDPEAYPVRARVILRHPEDECYLLPPPILPCPYEKYHHGTYVNFSDGSFRIDNLSAGRYKVYWNCDYGRPYDKVPIYIEISPGKGTKVNLPIECYFTSPFFGNTIGPNGSESGYVPVSISVPKQVIIGKKFFAACIWNNSVNASADLALVIKDDDGNEILRINDKVQEPNETYCIESYEGIIDEEWAELILNYICVRGEPETYYYVAPDELIFVASIFQILPLEEEPINPWEIYRG
jgi:hypothetical protein